MRELLTGIFAWPWFSKPHGYDFNGTSVLHGGGNLCIDPVEPPDAVLDRLSEEGVARILIDFDVLLLGDGVAIPSGGRECLQELIASVP